MVIKKSQMQNQKLSGIGFLVLGIENLIPFIALYQVYSWSFILLIPTIILIVVGMLFLVKDTAKENN